MKKVCFYLGLLWLTGCNGLSTPAKYLNIEALPDTVEGRDKTATLYYWVQTNYSCTLASGVKTNSYRGAIQVGTTSYTYYGDFCNPTVLATGPLSDLVIQGSFLAYREGLYQKAGR